MARRYYRTRSEGAYGYRSGGYRRRERRTEERTVEMVSFGLIIVLFAVTLLYPINPATIALLGGVVLVGSAVFQWQRRWRVNPVTWIGGAILLVVGILGLQGQAMPLGIWLPLLVFGAVLLASFLTGEF